MPLRLLVEGSDDYHLIKNVAREHAVDISRDDVSICGGIRELLSEVLPVSLKGTFPVAVVVDADTDPQARWTAVTHRLREAGYEPPNDLPPAGLILRSHRPAAGVWLMPDNSLAGMLEDFASNLIPSQDPLWPRAMNAVAEIPTAERRFTTTRKAEIHTYLAWQEEPGTPLGLAVTKRYFQTDSDLCKRFVDWLKQLKDIT
ncbi:MAG TPA: DUF3226 domain-containing protein [Thermoanaerobaculia bacterium]